MTGLDDHRRSAAIDRLPVLARALFLLHNFYDVGLGAMADTLGEDRDTIMACLVDARAIIRAHVCYSEPVPSIRPSTAALQARLQRDYRQALESAFAESGYSGDVAWPIAATDVAADQKVAAAFVVARLPAALRKAVARSRRGDIAVVDLWRFVWPWRMLLRRKLLRVADALQCAGWEPFDEWLAERLMPGRRYPHGYEEYRRRRRPLPDERPRTEAEKNGAQIADTVQIPERLAGEPELTRQVWILFHLYGRPYEEITRRLGISRRRVKRLRERADYATIGMSYPSFGERIRFELMAMRLGLECRWDIFQSVFYG